MGRLRPQAAAIPWRRGPRGQLEVLLVSATGGGWTVPKGNVERQADPPATARAEAREEAGIEGSLGAELGRFEYEKRGRAYRVVVYGLEVSALRARWREEDRRVRTWVPIERAPGLLRRPQLGAMVRLLARRLVGEAARVG